MRVLITGAAGLIGKATVSEFLDRGYLVRALDVAPLPVPQRERVEPIYCDILDKIGLLRACDGCDCVIHLAAIPVSERETDRLFEVNAVGAQLVLSAAESVGIRRVALASSNCASGMVYSNPPRIPEYLPIDGLHPDSPRDYYSLSKLLNEQTARTFADRGEMTVVCLRPTTVIRPHNPERIQWLRWSLQHRVDLRYNDFWAYIDVRDAARAFREAVERPLVGHHVIHIAAFDSYTVHDIRDLVRQTMPSLAGCCERLDVRQSLYDVTAMREKLGFTSTRSWRDIPELADIESAEMEVQAAS